MMWEIDGGSSDGGGYGGAIAPGRCEWNAFNVFNGGYFMTTLFNYLIIVVENLISPFY